MQKGKTLIVVRILTLFILFGAAIIQNSTKDDSHYLNMEQVIKIESTTNGSLITLENGEGYYWEGVK